MAAASLSNGTILNNFNTNSNTNTNCTKRQLPYTHKRDDANDDDSHYNNHGVDDIMMIIINDNNNDGDNDYPPHSYCYRVEQSLFRLVLRFSSRLCNLNLRGWTLNN